MADSTRPQYRYEYAGPVVDLIVTFGTEWSLDFHVGNRGSTEETFVVTMTRSGPGGERFATTAASVPAQQARGLGIGFEVDPDVDEFAAWWPRIYATSRQLVPSMHFHVEETLDNPPPDPFTEASIPLRNQFYVSPNDFAVFELRSRIVDLPTAPIAPGVAASTDRPSSIRWRVRELPGQRR